MHNDKYSYGSSFIAFPFAKHAIQNVSPNSTIRSRHCDTIMQAPCNNCIRKKKELLQPELNFYTKRARSQ
jgi:hypothetical protein